VLANYIDFNTAPSPDRKMGPDGFPLPTSGTYFLSGGKSTPVKGPLGKGEGASLISINAAGQMLLSQGHGNVRSFLRELGRARERLINAVSAIAAVKINEARVGK